jgi:hypothetical protein
MKLIHMIGCGISGITDQPKFAGAHFTQLLSTHRAAALGSVPLHPSFESNQSVVSVVLANVPGKISEWVISIVLRRATESRANWRKTSR